MLVGSCGFDSTIPAGATITAVTVSVEWKVSTTASIATLGAQAWVNNTAFGSELVNSAEPTTDTTQSFTVTGLTRAQLLNGTFEVRVRATRGNTNTAFTASLDAVSVAVTYTSSSSQSVTVNAVGATTAKGADTFAYDQVNRLTQATVAGVTETSTYDGDGVRFSRQVGGGPLTRYVTDPAAGLPVTVDDGTRKHVLGLGLAYAVTGSAIEVYHTDRLGSVRALTDAAGTVTATYRSDEFGIPVTSTGTSSQPFRYTGEPSDASGLTYLRARYYDPSVGRFQSRDTWRGLVSSPQLLGRYIYVANNPVTRSDPGGHCAIDAGADLAFIGIDLVALVFGPEKERHSNMIALGADVGGLLVPCATGLGIAVKAGIKAVGTGGKILEGANALRSAASKFGVDYVTLKRYVERELKPSWGLGAADNVRIMQNGDIVPPIGNDVLEMSTM